MSIGFFCASEYLPVQGEPDAAARSAAPAGDSLPCLQSNNSIETTPKEWQILGGGHRRMAFVLAEEMILLGRRYGVERLGFLTLTFADQVKVLKEAQRRFNSLNSNVIRLRYVRAIGVWERQKSGRIHFHLVVVLPADIRTGFDFEAVERQDYRSANSALRSEWAFWRKTAKAYGFGRTELLPVKSTAEGIARYVGKYVSKHIREREQADKGARVVRFLGYKPSKELPRSAEHPNGFVVRGDRNVSARFAWNTDNGWLWRQKCKAFFQSRGIHSLEEVQRRIGPRWAWQFKAEILATPLTAVCFPSRESIEASDNMEDSLRQAQMEARKILEGRDFIKTYLLAETCYKRKDTSTTVKEANANEVYGTADGRVVGVESGLCEVLRRVQASGRGTSQGQVAGSNVVPESPGAVPGGDARAVAGVPTALRSTVGYEESGGAIKTRPGSTSRDAGVQSYLRPSITPAFLVAAAKLARRLQTARAASALPALEAKGHLVSGYSKFKTPDTS